MAAYHPLFGGAGRRGVPPLGGRWWQAGRSVDAHILEPIVKPQALLTNRDSIAPGIPVPLIVGRGIDVAAIVMAFSKSHQIWSQVLRRVANTAPERSAARRDDGEALLAELLGPAGLAAIDLFDRLQLCQIIRVCRECSSLSAAGRRLFAASRAQKSAPNDADRLRKYLARFGLDWGTVTRRAEI